VLYAFGDEDGDEVSEKKKGNEEQVEDRNMKDQDIKLIVWREKED